MVKHYLKKTFFKLKWFTKKTDVIEGKMDIQNKKKQKQKTKTQKQNQKQKI